MNYFIRALVPLLSFVIGGASYAEDFDGKVLALSATIKVSDQDNTITEYKTGTELTFASVRGTSLSLGMSSKCPPYLGKLAGDFLIIVQARDSKKAITYPKSNDTTVFGTCGSTGTLTELHIQNSVPTVQTIQ